MQHDDVRILVVHAHPDDEAISTGGTLALLTRDGVDVTLLTCTRGERGEVIPVELRHLEGDGRALADYRERELEQALAALGVTRHMFLGQQGARLAGLPPRRYSDSGMVWGADGTPEPVADPAADALCSADLAEVVSDIRSAIDAVGAHAVLSYDERGGYGHPDHVRAHQAAREAARLSGVAFYSFIESVDELDRLEAAGQPVEGVDLLDVSEVLAAKVAALRAHATQITVSESADGRPLFALSSGPARPVETREAFRLIDSASAEADGPSTATVRGALSAGETRAGRITTAVVALAMGAILGVVLTINHQQTWSIGGVAIPIGLIAGLLIITMLLVGFRLVFETRVVALSAAIGVNVIIAVFSQKSPGGSVLIPANVMGFVWAYAPLLIALVVVAWPKLPLPRRDRMVVHTIQEGPSQ
ncbi:PIG-L family deacetylase [Salinibacterium hongtaonis]|uniref:PIG-L family deacetylase n=1 Tax=Homoserinimonas hongtaonis TaxID=2079791 RepID=UPI000D344B51|nr:PIG-L family deacetylase [Salinibacterium hongtaonis]AWB89729.1 mycothiol biosynthesis protein [Salinibacterium hongtaonis]